MIVSDENRAAVREFIRILVDLKIDESAVKFIVSALQTLEQMDEMVAFIKAYSLVNQLLFTGINIGLDEMVAFIKANIDASEEELVDKAIGIARQSA